MRGIRIGQSITEMKDPSLKLYFKEVSKYPLLSLEEEQEIARKVKNGDKEALQKLITSNLRFVISVAKQYQGKGIPLVDLIQAGNIALIECIDKYDVEKGCKFISFAVWWIRQAILKTLSTHCRTIRIPTNQILYKSKISKEYEKFEQKNGFPPSYNDLEEITNLSLDKITDSQSYLSKVVSLDSPFKEGDVMSLLDVTPNTNVDNTDHNIVSNGIAYELDRILADLPNRNSDTIRMLFGIDMPVMSISSVANYFGIGEERVRQIQKTTLKHLRDNYGDKLRELL